MTKKQNQTIKELRNEVRELKKLKFKCNQLNNEIFRKDEKILSLENKLNKRTGS